MSEEYEGYVEDAPQIYEGAAEPLQPVPVTIESQREAPQLASCMTWSVPQNTTNMPIQVLQRTVKRFKAKITITALGGATQIVFSQVQANLQAIPPVGCAYTAVGTIPDWESQQPLYVTAVGGGPASVAVQDERYI